VSPRLAFANWISLRKAKYASGTRAACNGGATASGTGGDITAS